MLTFRILAKLDCPMRLILVRHGESEWNREDRILGQSDVELSELGRRQAESVAGALRGERIQAVYCSPLKRVMETARMISIDQGCALISDPNLKELGRGNLEGLARQEAFLKYPVLQRTWPEVPSTPGLHGQEPLSKLSFRVKECLDRIKAKHPRETVAVVGHYFANLAILLNILGLKPGCFRNFGQDIAAISIVEIKKDRSTICLLNDTCHLERG
jgi:broad specificity phosphatase PhoE